jgi:NSS family neurotransmitter:Na+ symporter
MVYFLSSFTFSWGSDTTSFFANTVGGGSDFANAGVLLIYTTICVVLLWIALWFISHRDVDKGIGRVSKVLIPALFVMMAIIVFYAFTLPGHMIGVDALIRSNWSALLDIDIWLAACGQILFSLSMGQAIALTYASYLPENSRLTDNVLIVVAANSFFEIFTAFGVFSILGFMSLHSGIRLSNLATGGTGLVFDVFPMIFNVMGPIARVLAPLFFLAILFAGITSALAIFEPMLSSICHKMLFQARCRPDLPCPFPG